MSVRDDLLGLPISAIQQVIFVDHEAMVGWRSCLHGLEIGFHAFCITHGTGAAADTVTAVRELLQLREWCPACHAAILHSRTAAMEKQMGDG